MNIIEQVIGKRQPFEYIALDKMIIIWHRYRRSRQRDGLRRLQIEPIDASQRKVLRYLVAPDARAAANIQDISHRLIKGCSMIAAQDITDDVVLKIEPLALLQILGKA